MLGTRRISRGEGRAGYEEAVMWARKLTNSSSNSVYFVNLNANIIDILFAPFSPFFSFTFLKQWMLPINFFVAGFFAFIPRKH
jgi:hypothetical protein